MIGQCSSLMSSHWLTPRLQTLCWWWKRLFILVGQLCETFNIAGTSGSYLKTLGNCLPRNNILTSGKCGKVSLETRLGAWQNNHHLDCGHRVNIYIQTSKYSDTDTSSNQLDSRLSTFSFMYCTAHVWILKMTSNLLHLFIKIFSPFRKIYNLGSILVCSNGSQSSSH